MNEILLKENNPLVTVGLPVYNDENYVRLAIESIIKQTYKNWRAIIIDDGSTDNTLNIIKEYQADGRITLISGENLGLVARLNQLIDLCETKYYFRMDSDDIMHPERLQMQVEIMETNPDIDVLGTNAFTIDENNYVIGIRAEYNDKTFLKKVKSFIHPTVMGKTAWFKENPYDPDALRMEDVELWYRTSDKCNFMIITKPLFFYREVGENYYKKYYLISKSKKAIQRKYSNDSFWKKFFIKNTIIGFIYRVFNLINQEQKLVNKRNKVVFNKKLPYENYTL